MPWSARTGLDFAPPDSNRRTNNSVLLESFYRERQQQDSGISYHSELQAINSRLGDCQSMHAVHNLYNCIYRLIFYTNMQLISLYRMPLYISIFVAAQEAQS